MDGTRPTVELETQERRVHRQQDEAQTPTHLEEVLQFHALRSGSGAGGAHELLRGGVGVVVRRGQGDGHDLRGVSVEIPDGILRGYHGDTSQGEDERTSILRNECTWPPRA
jgi:hypothetical protein